MTMEEKSKTEKDVASIDFKRSDCIGAYLITVCIGFVVMLVSNSVFLNKYPETIIIGLSGLLVLFIMSLTVWLLKKEEWFILIFFVITAVLTAAGLTILKSHFTAYYIIYPFTMFFFSFSYLRKKKKKKWITTSCIFEHIILVALPEFVLNLVYVSLLRKYQLSLDTLLLVPLLIIAVPLINSINILRLKQTDYSIKSCLKELWSGVIYQAVIIIAILAVNGFFELFDLSKSDFFDSGLILLLLLTTMRDSIISFDALIDAEDIVAESRSVNAESNNEYGNLKKDLEYKRRYIYSKIIMLCCGTALFLLFAPAGFFEIKSFALRVIIEPLNIKRIETAFLLIGLLLIILFVGCHINSIINKKKNKHYWVTSAIVGCIYLLTDGIMFFLNFPYRITLNPIRICALFQIIGSAALVAESFYSNIYRIRNTDFRWEYMIDSFMIFILSSITLFFTIMPTEGATFGITKGTLSVSFIIISIVGNIWVLVVLPVILFLILRPEYQYKDKNELETIPGEIAKNGFLAVLIAFVAGAMPIMIYSVNDNLAKTVLGIMTSVLPIYLAVKFCTKNNIRHLLKREEELWNDLHSMDRSEWEVLGNSLTGLERHLRCQNFCALFSLLLYCIFPMMNPYSNLDNQSKGDLEKQSISHLKNYKKDFKDTYYPTLQHNWEILQPKHVYDPSKQTFYNKLRERIYNTLR